MGRQADFSRQMEESPGNRVVPESGTSAPFRALAKQSPGSTRGMSVTSPVTLIPRVEPI